MRAKERRLVVTFPSTTAAMAMEQHCAAMGIPGRLIPVPRAITASCGMAWSAPTDARARVEDAAAALNITARFYELEI